MQYQTLEYNRIKLTVHYTLDGKYYPATQYEPEEKPEVEIHKITAVDSDVDLMEGLFDEDSLEIIYSLLYEYL